MRQKAHFAYSLIMIYNGIGIERGNNVAVSEAQKRATAKYEKKAYVQVRTRFKPDDAKFLYEHAEKQNESVNGFVNRAVLEQIKRDNAKDSE